MITVIDVIRAMGIEPTPELCWSVGDKVRDLYEREVGHLPVKVLRQKTYDKGSHCFAAYPEEWRPRVQEIIRSMQTETSRQGELAL